ncbi:MAG: hypothetical protein NDJ89_01285 [Oligoflexia bacterium]|nr:hypothetical protein [Oligoflexia bacterium]
MKRRNGLMIVAAGLLIAGNLFAADQVNMATSEDLSAFDAQLGAMAPAAARAQAGGNGLGQVISEEAHKLRDSVGTQQFGQQVKQRAIQNGSAAASSKGVSAETRSPGKKSKK